MSPPSDDEDVLVLHGQAMQLAAAQQKCANLHGDEEMEELRAQADALLGRTPEPAAEQPPGRSASNLDWDAVVERHRAALESDGIDTSKLCLDQLMTVAEREVFEEEWQLLLMDIEGRLDEKQLNQLADACKRSVLDAIVRPFGLGTVVARFDKRGGGVLTRNNAEAARNDGADTDEFANVAKLGDYRARMNAQYDRQGYDEGFSERRKAMFKSGEPIVDAYTGKELPRDGRMHLDHVVAAKEVDRDSGANFYLTEDEKREFALSDQNIVPTDSGLNQSKNDKKLDDWLDTERRDGTTNEERFDVDRAKARGVDGRARGSFERTKTEAAIDYYVGEQLKAGAIEAGKMGLQQAVGLLLAEMAVAFFDEIVDVYKNGMVAERPDATFLAAVTERLHRVYARVAARWKDALSALVDGGLSGFFSSLVTTAINMVITTGRRVVRVIREGIFSLWRALKMLVSPPANMTQGQAAHEASKLVAAGVAIGVGVMAEEAVHKAVLTVPPLVPLADGIAAVVTGIGTGLATVLIVYVIDRIDVFGARKLAHEGATLAALEEHANAELALLEAGLGQAAMAV